MTSFNDQKADYGWRQHNARRYEARSQNRALEHGVVDEQSSKSSTSA
jgi:hypothetical protein